MHLKTLVFTSRTKIWGAWGLFETCLIQRDKEVPELSRREDKILEGGIDHNTLAYKIMVPYYTSPRLTKDGTTTKGELTRMYRVCLDQLRWRLRVKKRGSRPNFYISNLAKHAQISKKLKIGDKTFPWNFQVWSVNMACEVRLV